jgi:uncharacterized SAM-binding protein YcdF (DUF218 family)
MQFLKRWLIRLTSALGFAFLVITFTPIDYWWATRLAGSWNDPQGEVLVVLTGSMLDDGTIGVSSYWRALYAARVFQQEHFKEMIISGGGPDIPSSAPMRDFVVSQGVPRESVRLEAAALSTRDSAVNVAAILRNDPRRAVLLTSDYHMFRSSRAFRRAGAAILPRPIPDARKRYGSPLNRWEIAIELAQETAKIAYYWVRRWI